MKKKWIWICGGGIVIIGCLIVIFLYQYLRVKYAKIEVTLESVLEVPLRSQVKASDMIVSLNGTLIEDPMIDTSDIGMKELKIFFRNDDGIKVSYVFSVKVVDNVAPIVWLNNQYTVNKGASSEVFQKIMCADDYDANPTCEVRGDYDLNTVGVYPLVFEAQDSSGNKTEKKFNLRVQEPPKKGNSSSSPSKVVYTDYQQIVRDYKNEKTEIGIDISHWQGDVDFEALKAAGVEFIFIRVGTSTGIDGENILDKKFEQNITRANEVGIPVGIYFYSYANSLERAVMDANWVLEQIKDKKVDLPIAFDWENWSSFNEFHLSLFGLSDMANAFLDVIESSGYVGMLYSSKSYLEQVWYPSSYKTWLAHYTSKTNYQGDYEFWQLCSDGAVNGIQGAVDINVRYKN